MELCKIVEKNRNEIITVVGAGGKTSFINLLANYYKNDLIVLLTTTTKIYKPQNKDYDNIFMLYDNKNINLEERPSLTVCGKYINHEDKIVGLDFDELENLVPKFELVLIEGDGSKTKQLKGWSRTEPVVYNKTTKTVGILDITSYDLEINDENIHRMDEFKKLTDITSSNITIDNLVDVVLHKNGLFKNATGKKILFINKVENQYYKNMTNQLIKKINQQKHDIHIMYGSIRNRIIKEVLND